VSEQVTSGRFVELMLGSSVDITGDRRRQVAVVIWVVAAVCFAFGFAPVALNAPSQTSPWIFTILFSIVFWLREAAREERRGARAAMAIATVRVGVFWALIFGFYALARLVALVAPDDIAWLAGWWVAAAGLTVLGGFVWLRERGQHLALVGVCAGLLIAFGSLAGYAAGGVATIVTVIGVPVGLVILYISGRSGL
jgi:hypothetical protein